REMLEVARANLERAGLRHWQVRQGDLYQLPLPSAAFDVAVMHQVLHYLEDPEDALEEAGRVLRPGGVLLIADFAPHDVASLRDEHAHRWLGFDDAQVTGWLAAAGFDTDSPIHLPGHPLTVTIWRAVRKPRPMLDRVMPSRHAGDAQWPRHPPGMPRLSRRSRRAGSASVSNSSRPRPRRWKRRCGPRSGGWRR